MKKFFAACAASLFVFSGSVRAEEAAPAAAPAAVEAPAVPALDVDALLAGIPDVVAMAKEENLVTKAQILEIVKPALENALKQGAAVKPEMVMNFVYEVANSLAMRGVLLNEARKAGVEGDAASAKAQLDQMKQAIIQQGGEEAFAEQLKQLGKNEDGLLQMIIEEGMIRAFSDQLKAVAEKQIVAPTEEEGKAFYEENKAQLTEPASLSASHILVQFPSQAPTDEQKAAALAKIKEIQGKLAADGSNFAELAKEFSDCPSKQQGGDLGEFPKGAMVPEFEAALVALKEGEISGPVETMFGYHLIKAGAAKEEHVIAYEEAKDQILEFLKNQKLSEVAQKQLKEIMDNSGMKLMIQPPAMLEIPTVTPAAEAPAAEAPAAKAPAAEAPAVKAPADAK